MLVSGIQSEADPSPGILGRIGEAIGNLVRSIPSAWNDFFGGVARGAGINGWIEWAFLILGLAMFISAINGFRRRKLFWPIVIGSVGVGLIGWTVAS